MKPMKKTTSVISLALIGVLVAALIVGNFFALKYAPIISTYLGHTTYKVIDNGGDEDTTYFKRTYTSEAERLASDAEAGRAAAAEGFVLLKNEGKALPMSAGSDVTLFGVSSADILYGGGGSGAVDTSTVPTLKTALEAAGFKVNETMWKFYTEGAAKDIRMDAADIAGNGRYVIHEADPDLFTDQEKNSFGGTAIVTFARSGSESSDLPVVYDESYLEDMDVPASAWSAAYHSNGLDSGEDVGRSYLELTYTEEKLLEYVSRNFENTIVVINAGNPMNLSFLDEEKYGVDACIWIGNPGQDGLYALGDILNGTVNPSGRTVDTYAYHPENAPAVVNFGKNNMVGADEERFNKYVVYQEGIYVGYRYYETRFEDVVLNLGNAGAWNYEEEVQFPFGYGLSYTTFEQELTKADQDGDVFRFEVKVTNTGDAAGKEVVEIYAQTPYTDYDRENRVEKSAVQLVGFGKTGMLEPGASETVKVTVNTDDLKAYDAYGKGTYILEAGEYYFAAASDVHDAVQRILAAKGALEYDSANTKSFSLSEKDSAESVYTGSKITNQFADADMISYDDSFVYTSRNDWEGTYPTHYAFTATADIIAALAIHEGQDDAAAEMPVTGGKNGLTLVMMRDVDAEDEIWEDFLDQLTAEEMYNLVRVGGYQTQTVNSVSAPATVDVDGPAFVGNAGVTGVALQEKTYAWPSEVVLASTWNVEILEKMGEMIGEDCLAQGELNFAGWYAPAMNIHRTAFSGRNFEYYSEDGYLSGICGAATIRGARKKGVITYAKHFALNDQETNRTTINTFANEQSIREVYLKAFEAGIADQGDNTNTLAIMASMNRVGLLWSGNHTGLMKGVLRDEWGFDGFVITDQASYPSAFPGLAVRGGLEGGVDLWLNTGADNWAIENYQSNATVMSQLRGASRHILYSVSRSLAMNGISSTASVVNVMPLWQKWMIAADVIIGLLALAGIYTIRKKSLKTAE